MHENYNTLAGYWKKTEPRQFGLTPAYLDAMRAAFYAGASAVLAILGKPESRSPAAQTALRQSLSDEIIASLAEQQEARGCRNRPMPASVAEITTFKVPLVGTGAEAGRRAAIAIELAKTGATAAGCAALMPYLIEAMQHCLAGGATELELTDDMTENADWWHRQMHDGITPADAASAALGKPKTKASQEIAA